MIKKLVKTKNIIGLVGLLAIFVILNFDKNESNDFQNYNVCVLAQLDYNVGLESLKPNPQCKVKHNWGYIDRIRHAWTLNKNISTSISSIRCKYIKISRIDDFRVHIGQFIELNEGDTILDDVFEIKCHGNRKKDNVSENFENLFVQVVDTEIERRQEREILPDDHGCSPYDVMLISYDSVSKVSFINRLKKTFEFINKSKNFYVLNGYNIVGDGTPAALIPIFTGQTEEELPSGLKNDPNGKYVDEIYPFIWKDLHQKNFTSIYLDDWPQVGAFTYRMRGFKNHAAKHYPKHYQLKLKENIWNKKINDYCNGDTKRHKILIDLLLEFKRLYHNKQSNLAIMHYVENSHDSNDHLHWLDDDILYFLNTGINEKLFDNTILFLYSDHGSRFNKKRSSQRYLEERLPFFSIYLPDKFIQNDRAKLKNLENNLNKLTSPFDVYDTVRDITCLERTKKTNRNRSISLFDNISKYRSCEDIGIAEHFCSCVKNWKYENSASDKVLKSIEFAVDSINKITNMKRDLCQKLTLKKIILSEKLATSSASLYRVSFITSPNNGVYETIIYDSKHTNFEFSSDNFSIKSKNDISRIDSYGEQPWCVAKFGSNPGLLLDLRKFCFCYQIDKKN